PQASELAWADGRQVGFSAVTDVNDLQFISDLIDELSATYDIDTERIYLVGLGGGGSMAYRLACELPERFAGVAVVGTLLWNYHETTCPQTSAPLDLLIIHGTDDPTYWPEGHIFTYSSTSSVDETLDFWAQRIGCDGTPTTEDNLTTFSDCDSGHRLAFYSIEGGGSAWPHVGDYYLNQFGVDATDMVLSFFTEGADWTPPEPQPVDEPEAARGYALYVPSSYDSENPTPLVITLHGRPDNGAGIAYITDMNKVAEREGFIALYPDGLNNEWNYGRDISIYPQPPQDDTRFLTVLMADLAQDLNIDPARVYVTGFSNGGFMTERLACEVPDQYAAYAAVGATAYLGMLTLCEQASPVPIMFIHGTHDISIPWNGMPREFSGRTLYVTAPVLNSLEYWVQHNDCGEEYQQNDIPPAGDSPETTVRQLIFNCANDTQTIFYGIAGGGHNWPGVPDRIPADIAGKVNTDINASEVIWEFFSHYSRAIN
ncbi:MAG: hypothetical protein K8L99_20270, partial [Anaerolineae bacterium]|nr:hypothetical protein [Anaerolineae bacterium]